jgi:DNA-binding CsgD family transcriptional regulator
MFTSTKNISVVSSARHGADVLNEPLTDSEKRVISLLAAGAAPATIALETGTKITTIRTHLKSIRRKLDVNSNIQALSMAWRRGLVEIRS